jgi:hypothetical protein
VGNNIICNFCIVTVQWDQNITKSLMLKHSKNNSFRNAEQSASDTISIKRAHCVWVAVVVYTFVSAPCGC